MFAAIAAVGVDDCAAHEVGRAIGSNAGGQVRTVLAILLTAFVVMYAKGTIALWRKAGAGRGIRRIDAALFALGSVALAVALLSPIDGLAERSFALHMIQHEILVIIAAPLLVLGRPIEAIAWSSPQARRMIAAARGSASMRALGGVLSPPASAWTFHAVALWLWHLPILFRLALASTPIHILQHVCFFVSALAFWWTVFGGAARVANATSVASVFTTMLHTSALGALLTFAPTPWYAIGDEPVFGLTHLEDQQLGGLVMWIPGGFAYMIAGLVIVGKWLARPDARRPA